MRNFDAKLFFQISIICLFFLGSCEANHFVSSSDSLDKLSRSETKAPHNKRKPYFSDEFEAESDQELNDRTSDSGHSYSGADVEDFEVEASSNSINAPGDPDGNAAWWATPDVETPNSKYRTVIQHATLGGAARWFHLFVGVRHDGSSRGSETAYALELAGGNVGLVLHRTNAGADTVLASDPSFSSDYFIEGDTPVSLELQAKTVGQSVILNSWVTIGEGERQHVFRNVEDKSDDRITDSGSPAFGFSPIAPRIGKAEVRKNVAVNRSEEDETDDGDGSDGEIGSSAGPPLQDQFERDMLYYGLDVGNWQQTVSTQQSQYYDGLFVHLQVRDYIQENNLSSTRAQEYLDNVSSYIDRSLQVVRDGYVLPNNGVVDDWRRFPKGLYYHYQETGDQASYDAALLLRDGRTVGTGNPGAHPEFGHASWIREMSYWLQAHIWGEKLDGTRDVDEVKLYIQYLENHLYQTRNNDYSNPPGGDNRDAMQAFYMGLAGQALIEWYELAGNTYWPTDNWATIPDALQDVFGWMMDQGPNGAKVLDNGTSDPHIGHPFWVEDYNNSGYGLFHSWDRDANIGTAPYSDVSNLIAPVYYWIGQHYNSQEFIELGDKVFAGAVYHQSFAAGGGYGKRYDQQYITIFDGLEWRQEYFDTN